MPIKYPLLEHSIVSQSYPTNFDLQQENCLHFAF